MNDTETTADVIAAMRDEGRTGESSCLEWVGAKMRHYADRLEVAHKRAAAFHAMTCEANDRLREHLRIALDANGREHGDAAKLREAVIETQSVIAKCMDVLNRIPDSCGYGGLVDDVADELCDLRERYVMPALAAPLRNCDRPECATLEMATKTWIREELGPHCNNSKATMGDIRTFDVWIYATATEQEGGNDADK